MKIYSVGSNKLGCLPEEESNDFVLIKEAKECLLTNISLYLEECNLDSRFTNKNVKDWTKKLADLEKIAPQECTFKCGDREFWLRELVAVTH